MNSPDYASWSSALTFAEVEALFMARGCNHVLVKELAARQDNDKNQIYVGKDLASVSNIPSGEVAVSVTESTKPGASGKSKFQAPVNFSWLTSTGPAPAPHAKLIYYPQYPEVRFSGFLLGAKGAPNDLLSRAKRGQEAERVLLMGVTNSDEVFGLVLGYEAASRSNILNRTSQTDSPLGVWTIGQASAGSTQALLLDELERIYALGWIPSTKLKDGKPVPYQARNGGGYTLEAQLGISPNGIAEPDFLGWEIKQHSVKSFEKPGNSRITLFTPEPTAGIYVSPGFHDFMARFGYPDKDNPDRTNFGGIYKANQPAHHLTGLRLELSGYTNEKNFNAAGALALVAQNGTVAAEWPYAKLMEHWKRKHAAACYVPSLKRETPTGIEYRYGRGIFLAGGATFGKLLTAIDAGNVYLDPALKLIFKPDGKTEQKKRNQFRTPFNQLKSLYEWASYYGGEG